jgi:TIGR03009 family protein
MLRNLGVGRLVGLILLGVCSASGSWLRAQDARSLDRGIGPGTTQNDGGDQPRERLDRRSLTRPDLRADSVDNAGQPVDPQVEALLEKWSQRTKEIKRLQGRHVRMTREFSFGTESVAQGQFYVETPDKGRIDVEPYDKKLKPGATIERVGPNRQKVELTVKSDSMHSRWICDGNEIKVIDDDHKTYDAVKIPPNQRGENIMDGPLPFLFGMPPEKAKARYWFKYLGQDPKNGGYAIEVKPKLKQDAVDWSLARLLLDRKTFLPMDVILTNAAGSTETEYRFGDLQINRIRFIFWTDPFNPSLAIYGYKRSVHNVGPGGPGAEPIVANKMPSLIGMPYKTVKEKLESLGHHVTLERGDPATAPEQVFHVEQQRPAANTPLKPHSDIVLKLYVRMDPKQIQQPQQLQNSSPVIRTDYRNDGGNDRPNDTGNQLQRTVAKPQDGQ